MNISKIRYALVRIACHYTLYNLARHLKLEKNYV